MSKNIVDVLISLSLEYPSYEFVFIPSRRQIDLSGGYVNNWTTQNFAKYVKEKNPQILLERDHGGPDQGLIYDDGFDSLREDCKYFDIIHIDPWKRYSNFNEGLEMTIKMIEFCYALNPSIKYEVSTEEAIRPFKTSEVESLLLELKIRLKPEVFRQIKFVVIQCGTALCDMKNCGVFNPRRLQKMLTVANSHSLEAKEHNGDWVNTEQIKVKESFGLKHINIAPELASVESEIVLKTVLAHPEHYNSLFYLCLSSDKWRKWVSPLFEPLQNKDMIIKICCHYLFCHPEFLAIKKDYPGLDSTIQSQLRIYLKNKLQLN